TGTGDPRCQSPECGTCDSSRISLVAAIWRVDLFLCAKVLLFSCQLRSHSGRSDRRKTCAFWAQHDQAAWALLPAGVVGSARRVEVTHARQLPTGRGIFWCLEEALSAARRLRLPLCQLCWPHRLHLQSEGVVEHSNHTSQYPTN